jgi:hypothetical protein
VGPLERRRIRVHAARPQGLGLLDARPDKPVIEHFVMD